MRKMLWEKYQLYMPEEKNISVFTPFELEDRLYVIAYVTGTSEAIITERQTIATHLYEAGDWHVGLFVPTNDGSVISHWENESYCLLMYTHFSEPKKKVLGRKLAKLHYRGRHLGEPVREINRVGVWKNMWEQRLDQMEKVWNQRVFQGAENEFERLFFESFPYYMGLTENAIQYLVDTEIDEESTGTDDGTVCHERFSEKRWGHPYFIKNPFDWVFDHCSRDVAEWTRLCYFENKQTYEPMVQLFFQQYESVVPLSRFSWRLLYARLLFPLHYFECIESYYIATTEHEKKVQEERLTAILRQTDAHELFLRTFYGLVRVPTKTSGLPRVDWL